MEGEFLFDESAEPPDGGASANNRNMNSVAFHKETKHQSHHTNTPFGKRFKQTYKSRDFRKEFFPDVSNQHWNDWRWQIRNRLTTLGDLEKIIRLSEDEKSAIMSHKGSLPLSITPYYASLLDRDNPDQALRKCVIPVNSEFSISPEEKVDPLGEDNHSPFPGLVHRYPDRVLFLTTDFCSVCCRYCTRSRLIGDSTSCRFNQKNWNNAIKYIESNPQIRDVLISGGDPFTLPDNKLEWLLTKLRRIPHVEFLRIGTKVPAVLPMRITRQFTRMLRRFHPLWLSIHFTHPDELTPETEEACNRLADAGIPLGSQTVLLKGVNDNVPVMKNLMQGLLKIRVKPYYLYQCDPIPGSGHFRTPVEKGLEIIRGLRGHTTGYAVPQYVIDAPGGGGKIPLLPDYIAGRDGDYLLLNNYEGKTYRYPDPGGTVGLEHVKQDVS